MPRANALLSRSGVRLLRTADLAPPITDAVLPIGAVVLRTATTAPHIDETMLRSPELLLRSPELLLRSPELPLRSPELVLHIGDLVLRSREAMPNTGEAMPNTGETMPHTPAGESPTGDTAPHIAAAKMRRRELALLSGDAILRTDVLMPNQLHLTQATALDLPPASALVRTVRSASVPPLRPRRRSSAPRAPLAYGQRARFRAV